MKIVQRGRYIILLFVCLIGILVAGGLYYSQSVSAYLYHLRFQPNINKELEHNLPHLFQTRGPLYSYEVVYGALNRKLIGIDECHVLLHSMGHAAYRKYRGDFDAMFDTKMKDICLNGYVHGIESEIAIEAGKDELWKFCSYVKKNAITAWHCFHGVGHSEFERTQSVTRSLAFCDSLQGGPESDITDCYRGIFSEIGNEVQGYSGTTGLALPPLVDLSQHISRDNPYQLCNTLDVRYADSCYSQLAKIYFERKDPLYGTSQCLTSSSNKAVVSTCIRIVAAIGSRAPIESGDMASLVTVINTASSTAQKDIIIGVRESYAEQKKNVQGIFEWNVLCNALATESAQGECRNFSQTKSQLAFHIDP